MLAAGEGAFQVELYEGPLSPGDTFERYQIRGEIARGGSAFVYDAYQEFLDRHVAIKVIPSKKEQAREFRRRAKAEAVVLSRLRHPNVVPVYDAGVTDDGSLIYIVMEKLDGCTLREVLQTIGPLSVPEALVMGAQACDAVEAAHRHGAIHRDLKPENLFIECENHLRVLDFGVAKFLGAGFATTAKHRWHGTPLYMSPEHLQGRGVTARSDIYALGTLLWESLAGRNPCLNGIDTPTFQEIGWIQIASVPPLLTEVVPAVPGYVARVIQRAIAKAPDNRYASMHELGVALRAAERRFTLEQSERRIAPMLRDLVECARAHAPRDTLRMPLPGPEAPAPAAAPAAIPRPPSAVADPAPHGTPLHVASVEPPGESAARPPRATVERTPSPVAAPVQERQPPAAHRERRARPARDARRRYSSVRLGLLGASVGLVIAIPIGIGIGLSRRRAEAAEPPVSAARAAASSAVAPAQALAPLAPPVVSATPAPSATAPASARTRSSAVPRATPARSATATQPRAAPPPRPVEKARAARPADSLPSSGLGNPGRDNAASNDKPLF